MNAPKTAGYARGTMHRVTVLATICVLCAGVGAVRADDRPAAALAADDYPGLENLIRLSETIYSGGEPHGDVSFESIARLGVTTIVSVDGARPDVERAREHGLRYIHIPIGYDGVGEEARASLVRLVQEVEGPIYVHCHHGVHRGPAAAAIACQAADETDREGALTFLERAGTDRGYAGLWRDVANFQMPAPGTVLPELVEVAKVDSLAAAMAVLDRAYDNLKRTRRAGWNAPADHPDLVPEQEALIVQEGLRESARHLSGTYDDRFRDWLVESERVAATLVEALKSSDADAIDAHYRALDRSCAQCHKDYRN